MSVTGTSPSNVSLLSSSPASVGALKKRLTVLQTANLRAAQHGTAAAAAASSPGVGSAVDRHVQQLRRQRDRFHESKQIIYCIAMMMMVSHQID